jgi:hypothetical protein
MDPGSLVLDLNAVTTYGATETEVASPHSDKIWLTESTVGGGGFVEEFVRQYVQDPRRYFRLIDSALAPSELESVSEDLGRLLQLLTSTTTDGQRVADAFASMREAGSHGDMLRALNILRAELSHSGIQPSPTLLVSLNARLLRPGSNRDTDEFMANALQQWDESERHLGIDIDPRVFALVKSSDESLDRIFAGELVVSTDSSAVAWRYGVLYGLFWPRGAQIRAESLRVWNPFERALECDRLLVLVALANSKHEISLEERDWFEQLAQILVTEGAASLIHTSEHSDEMATALLRIAVEPVESDALLIHARLTGVRRESNRIIADIELPEAFQ